MKTKLLPTLFFVSIINVSLFGQNALFSQYEGQVIDLNSKEDLAACYVHVRDYDIGTVTNSDGEFAIKIPDSLQSVVLVFSNIGFQNTMVSTDTLKPNGNKIYLRRSTKVMDEVVVRDGLTIVKEALSKVKENYPQQPENLTAYYRESIRKNKKFVDISQGILDVYKQPYATSRKSHLGIVKGFKSSQYSADDTLVFKVQNGTNTMLMLDVVKNGGDILSRDNLDLYVYKLSNIVELDGDLHYEVSFEPVDANHYPKYSGMIYIHQKSMAISQINFGFAPTVVESITNTLIKRKPSNAKLTATVLNYEVKYQKSGDEWYLYYVKCQLGMKCNWKKKLFNKHFLSVSEMVVTERKTNDPKLPQNIVKGRDQIFSDEIPRYFDSKFWENYSIIRPEDNIIKALKRIKRRQGRE